MPAWVGEGVAIMVDVELAGGLMVREALSLLLVTVPVALSAGPACVLLQEPKSGWLVDTLETKIYFAIRSF